ncbi:hypothetical protein AVANS_0819 [Campylobacter sp. RM5004]|uniref:hypothetical protein n=1 Tax=Campylobacter sp. RM5004 TaxID=1660078 RepID=UPI001EFBC858|nr:hypothetical protein [Campylobacter sp. RM5004]ULO01448.1 hypothetical protein AVANS_0819 [Campylobacter sp. RM5004]
MEVTIKINDNPHFLKAVKQLAKAFNEPIKIQKQKSNLAEFYKSDEFLEALKEANELEQAYLRGEVEYLEAEKFIEESMKW